MRSELSSSYSALLPVRTVCCCLGVYFSGYYFWPKSLSSSRAFHDQRQTDISKKLWEVCGKVEDYRKFDAALLDQGEVWCPNLMARLTRIAGIIA